MDRIRSDDRAMKRLGRWTAAGEFEVRARHDAAGIDVRSARIPAGDVEIRVGLDHAPAKRYFREFVEDCRRPRRLSTAPTVADPS